MFTLIYPYRNRDVDRIKRSLDSLRSQTLREFLVSFVDYGSSTQFATDAKQLVESYDFASYVYHPTQYQPWNKCRALNSVIKDLDTDYCFVADVDMIFHPEFVQRASSMQHPQKAVYFRVGFLSEEESAKNLPFSEYDIKFLSDPGATGLTMFPVRPLQAIRGFDEFYHFWGSEDTDVHVRLENNGVQVDYYEDEVLLLHQWHEIYRNKEQQKLSKDLQISGIVQLNAQHLKNARNGRSTLVNPNAWGVVPSEKEIESLINANPLPLSNKREVIDAFIYTELHNLPGGIHAFQITDNSKNDLKKGLKKLLGRKTQQHYSLKEVNDKLLMHIISFYRHLPYVYRIGEDGKSIFFGILKQ